MSLVTEEKHDCVDDWHVKDLAPEGAILVPLYIRLMTPYAAI